MMMSIVVKYKESILILTSQLYDKRSDKDNNTSGIKNNNKSRKVSVKCESKIIYSK